LLVKPLTYMNLSGQAVAPLAREYGLAPDRILVVADELDLPVGQIKLKPKGSSAGHNGHKSIIASLRSEEYPRIRIGVGKVDRKQTIDHVLGSFDREEAPVIREMVLKATQGCAVAATQGLEKAITFVNSST
jgi:peptidyl-tRNA hydrolase, PTH1 family